MERMRKYPRTAHLEGSRVQPGDEDLTCVPFRQIAGRDLVVEEKMDGANAAISFDRNGQLLLQSRGHYLKGGHREKHFDLFKQWAQHHATRLRELLSARYVLYGEWLYAKHTVFYDQLPHYFMEFDVLDLKTDQFLSTARRTELLQGSPLVSVRVLHEGIVPSLERFKQLLTTSAFISERHREVLRESCQRKGLDPERVLSETDASRDMEGLYLKVEEDGVVTERLKFVRATFLTTVIQSETHWLQRPIIPNQLREGADIYADSIGKGVS